MVLELQFGDPGLHHDTELNQCCYSSSNTFDFLCALLSFPTSTNQKCSFLSPQSLLTLLVASLYGTEDLPYLTSKPPCRTSKAEQG